MRETWRVFGVAINLTNAVLYKEAPIAANNARLQPTNWSERELEEPELKKILLSYASKRTEIFGRFVHLKTCRFVHLKNCH